MKKILAHRHAAGARREPGLRPSRPRLDRFIRRRRRASAVGPRSHRGHGGGRPVGGAQGRPRAVGMAGGLRRRDAGRRRARYGACGGAVRRVRHSRLGGGARSLGGARGRPAGRGPALRSSRVFALLHGHAHGSEVAENVGGIEYMAGFALATATLHGVGIGFAQLMTRAQLRPLIRVAGAVCVRSARACTGCVTVIRRASPRIKPGPARAFASSRNDERKVF